MIEQKAFIKNLEIYYKVVGEGEKTLLILHGWGSKSANWLKTAELIAKRKIRVIIPDLPGFGKSNKPPYVWNLDEYCSFLKEFTDYLKLDKFCLLGHSFGGALAIKFSLKFSQRINKLFLVSAACIRRKTLKKKVLFIISKVFKIFSFLPIIKKAFYKFIVRSDYPSTKGFMRKTYLNIIREDLSPLLDRVSVPTVLIWGDKDKITPLNQGELIKSKIKKSRLVVIPDGTHDIERHMPEQLAKNVLC
jgi:pimeloyl-ACP methyl ester carboxylesterase